MTYDPDDYLWDGRRISELNFEQLQQALCHILNWSDDVGELIDKLNEVEERRQRPFKL